MKQAPRKECPTCKEMCYTGRKYCPKCSHLFYSTETTTVRKSPPDSVITISHELIAKVCRMYDRGLTSQQIAIALECV